MIKIVCGNCGKEFDRELKEFNRNQRLKRPNFCGRSCSCSHGNRKVPRNCGREDIKRFAGNRLDKFSPFRYYIRKSRCAEKIRDYGLPDITIEYLKELWESQNGICPYTGKSMEISNNPQNSDIKVSPTQASLDRIDSSKGYVKGNVEFVCYAVNLAKNAFSREQMISFFQKS